MNSGGADMNTQFDIQFLDHGRGWDGWRQCIIGGRVSGYQFQAVGVGSRDERALAFALDALARQLRDAFQRIYVQ